MTVTRKMITAAHGVAMKGGDVILSAELLTRIYEAMHAQAPQHQVSWTCPVCAASVEPTEPESESEKYREAFGYVLSKMHDIAKRPKDESAFLAITAIEEVRKRYGMGIA
jgi:hypothetical protein